MATTVTTSKESTSAQKKQASERSDASPSSASTRSLGIELEAAQARWVDVIDGCMADASTTKPKVNEPVIVVREAAGAATTPARAIATTSTTGKSRMVYQRPVNPKLVSARPPVTSPTVPSSQASASAKANDAKAASVDVDVVKDAATAKPSALPRIIAPPDEAIAPAAILPRFAGEPLRADLHWPPQARSTGEVWPPEARIESGQTSGRFPLAYAWHLLEAREPWSWNIEGRSVQLTAAQAIAQATESVMKPARLSRDAKSEQRNTNTAHANHNAPCALIVPDHLSMIAQQDLLDAARAHHIEMSLLPRPMAAAMAWCDRYASEITSNHAERQLEIDRPIGSILVMHMGLDMWEVTTVDLVPKRIDGILRLIPVRRRSPIAPLPSYGTELMHRLAIRSLEMSYQQMSAARVWELMWCTPWLKAAISMLSDGDVGFPSVVALAKHARSAEFLKQQCRQATQRIFRAVEPVAGLLRQCLGKTPQFTDIRDWFTQRKLEAPAEGFLGAIITGPMANMPLDKDTVGLHHLSKIWAKPTRVMIEGVSEPVGVLARSAAWHADFLRRHAQGDDPSLAPTYLEKLPQVRIAATVLGEPAWVNLIDSVPDYSPGGITITRPQPLTGFPIKADTTKFKIAIDHEDWPTVQLAAAPLPQVLSQPQPVELHASLRSSHGFPEIELVPVREGLFGRQRVLVDMRTMKDTGKSPDEFLKTVGR